MDEIFKPFLSGTTPLPPKLNVNVTWSALAPMDERNQTPNVTFGNTRAETLRFGGAGVQHSACCRVWIFCPSTVLTPYVSTVLFLGKKTRALGSSNIPPPTRAGSAPGRGGKCGSSTRHAEFYGSWWVCGRYNCNDKWLKLINKW